MDINDLKQEPGLVQHVQNEPALFVKQEIHEDSTEDGSEQQCAQGTSTSGGTGSVDEACDTSPGDLSVNVKHEMTDIEIGPTVLQHTDTHYTSNKNTSERENTIVNVCNKPMFPNNGIKKENSKDKLKELFSDWLKEKADLPIVKQPTDKRSLNEKRVRKEQNKNAASRYRQKKKAELEVLLGEEYVLRQRQDELHTKCSDMQREICNLKVLLRNCFKAKGLIK